MYGKCRTNAVDSIDLVSLVAVAVSSHTGGILGTIVVKLTGNVHCRTVAAKLGRTTSGKVLVRTLARIRANCVHANGI